MRFIAAILLSLALAGCSSTPGVRAYSFINNDIARAFIPLTHTSYVFMGNCGAAVVIAPGVAVTNAHLDDVVGKAPRIGRSPNYDLLFFRTARNDVPPTAQPVVGMHVVAYGTDVYGGLHMAEGEVVGLNQEVKPRCPTCLVQTGTFTFSGNAGPGFSGGPVVDRATGRLIGITFGYNDEGPQRVMYAYPISRVHNELETMTGHPPTDVP